MAKGYIDIVLGLQWGDEGKGRVVHSLSMDYSLVIRYQGGANAGHTVYLNGEKFVLHIVPTGILHPNTEVAIGAGVVLDPEILAEELKILNKHGISTDGRLFIDPRAPVVFPFHKLQDSLFEKKGGIGSTKRGIAPCYRDAYQRFAVRVGDISNRDYLGRIMDKQIEFNNIVFKHFGVPLLQKDDLMEWIDRYSWIFEGMVVDVAMLIKDKLKSGKSVLMEGAQGTLLDIFYGNYPYVTSSHTISGGALAGAGIGPGIIRRVYGVFKAYVTRVGKGPFPTELFDEDGERIATFGEEYGATTGRPRRVGWLDIPLLKYAMWLNGITHPIMTKLDVLENFGRVKMAVSYTHNGNLVDMLTPLTYYLEKVEPVYEEFQEFSRIKEAKTRKEFGDGVKRYINRIEELIGIKIALISKGKEDSLI